MKWKYSKHLTSGLVVLAASLAGGVYVIASDGMTALINTPVSITGPDAVCKKVTNASATGLSEYIPTATVAEWQSFVSNPPAGVSLASCATPGSQTYTTPGSYTFTVPAHNTLTVEVWGAGGGGAGFYSPPSQTAGTNGGGSTWDGGMLRANGGTTPPTTSYLAYGAGGTAVGGTTNITGGNGYPGNINGTPNQDACTNSARAGGGGNGANGGPGGPPVQTGYGAASTPGNPGSAPGGGGSGGGGNCYKGTNAVAAGAGGGGYASKTYAAGTYIEGQPVTVVVGAGGVGGVNIITGGAGADGRVTVTWN